MSTLTTLSGIVVLTGPRPVNPTRGSRDLYVDATIFASDNHSTNPSVGLVHFFNVNDNISFGYEPIYVHAAIHFANTPTNLKQHLLPENFTPLDYAFIGDISHISLLPDTVDACQHAYVTATGIVESTGNASHRTFTIKCDQYISIIKKAATCTLVCDIPNTECWKKTRLPQQNSAVSIAGTLQSISRDSNDFSQAFTISLDSFCFMPHPPLPDHAATQEVTSSSSTKTGFSYSHINKKCKDSEK